MEIFSMLDKMEYTLNQISVSGRADLDRMLGCIEAVSVIKNMVKEILDGGEGDGRQSDIGTDSGNNS